MLILDDLLLAPFKGIFWVFKKIDQATREELESQRQRTTSELSELYMLLDTGKITEQEFDAREKVLLDRLDQIKKTQAEHAGQGGRRSTRRAEPPAGAESTRK